LKIVEILGQIPTVVNNEEHAVYRRVSDAGELSTKKMSEYEAHIADQLRQKGLLDGKDKRKETIYRIAKF
jgi:hypothetical protein